MRIVLAATGHLGLSLLEPLLDSGHTVVGLLQDGRKTPPHQRGAASVLPFLRKTPSTQLWANVLGLHGIWLDKMDEAELAPVRALEPDVILVGGFGLILKRPLLELPRIGCVNVHSSLLPKHRGPNPFAAVLVAGESESGVTFHAIDERIDTGDILDQTAFPLLDDYTTYAVYRQACAVAGERVVAVMDRIEREGLRGVRQNHADASYDKRPGLDDAEIRWERPASRIASMVRALAPKPMPWFRYRGRIVHVASVGIDMTAEDAAPGTVLRNRHPVLVAAGEGAVRIIVAHVKRPVPWVWPTLWSRPKVGEIIGG